MYEGIPTSTLKRSYIEAFQKSPDVIIAFLPILAAISSSIGGFLLNLFLIPAILALILYAFMKPIIWGALTFIGLCFLGLVSIFIFKRIFIKKQPKGE